MNADAKMSVVLPTDTYATIRKVVDHLRRQTVRDQIEIVFVTPAVEEFEDISGSSEFASVRVVGVQSMVPLAAARAAGVRAATAPLVFIGETHTYPHSDWAEALIRAHKEPWSAVGPSFGNANPRGALSWAGFLSDYGRWLDSRAAGEIDEVPIYNAAYRRSVLMEFGDRLEHALSHGDELAVGLRSKGCRVYFEPAAKIDHVNVSQIVPWFHERFVGGILIGAARATRWSLFRRFAYVIGSPLIPVVLLSRVLKGVRHTTGNRKLPVGTIPAMVLGAMVKAVGEMAGYAGASETAAEIRMTDYEVQKVAYVGRARK